MFILYIEIETSKRYVRFDINVVVMNWLFVSLILDNKVKDKPLFL